jgi:hypothetical protein
MSDTPLSVENGRNLKEYADANGVSYILLSVETGRH